MKIKSLLLGSAAALVAVSGAQAADAIVVEPEPMEYVKVCDMYGAGYFYIPGTETCLKIGGAVRVQYSVAHDSEHESQISYHGTYVRAEARLTAKNETEYGTLGSDILLRMQRNEFVEEDANGDLHHDYFSFYEGHPGIGGLIKATINLAGFRMGYDADGGGAINRYTGYGFYNANASGGYSFDTATFFEYGGSAGGWDYVVGIQDSALSGSSGQPDLYAGLKGSVGGLALGAIVVYDSNGGWDDAAMAATGDGGIFYRVRADYDMSSMIPGGSIGAWWEADDGDTDYRKGHQWGVTMKANLTDKLVGFGGYSDHNGAGGNDGLDVRRWTAGVRWNVASGMYIQAEHTKAIAAGGTAGGYTIRFHRSF